MMVMMPTIKALIGREILDSRGNPTLEVEAESSDGHFAVASVPSGASTGSHEAVELRDNDPARYGGKGVLKAVANITKIQPAIAPIEVTDQTRIDQTMIQLDGTPHKSGLGANTTLAVSLAALKLGAQIQNLPLYQSIAKLLGVQPKLPIPMFNLINGASHADNNLKIQEFMIIPDQLPTYREQLRSGAETFHNLKSTLKNRGLNTAIGDEGGFSPLLPNDEEAIKLIMEAGRNKIGLDLAGVRPEEMDFAKLCTDYPVIYLEDPFPEDAWVEWQALTLQLGQKIMIVGDDLFVTDRRRLAIGIQQKAANSVIVKPNQIGTVTETIDFVKLARQNHLKIIASHRSGETEDTAIADLAVGIAADYIKTGAPCRGERIAKYNRLLRIEESLGR